MASQFKNEDHEVVHQEDGSIHSQEGSFNEEEHKEKANKTQWRRGKWTPEEEAYVSKITEAFHAGLLPLMCGTTLRSYLSEKLNCDPMRITKKFSGVGSIGKCIFHACDPPNPERSHAVMRDLEHLERIWRKKLEELRAVELEFQSTALPFNPSQPDRAAAALSWLCRSRDILAKGQQVRVEALDELIEEGQGLVEDQPSTINPTEYNITTSSTASRSIPAAAAMVASSNVSATMKSSHSSSSMSSLASQGQGGGRHQHHSSSFSNGTSSNNTMTRKRSRDDISSSSSNSSDGNPTAAGANNNGSANVRKHSFDHQSRRSSYDEAEDYEKTSSSPQVHRQGRGNTHEGGVDSGHQSSSEEEKSTASTGRSTGTIWSTEATPYAATGGRKGKGIDASTEAEGENRRLADRRARALSEDEGAEGLLMLKFLRSDGKAPPAAGTSS